MLRIDEQNTRELWRKNRKYLEWKRTRIDKNRIINDESEE
jgi:hypothetical protein